jgi:tripartite-type tricarboxylate transporter receptor subunit TctC
VEARLTKRNLNSLVGAMKYDRRQILKVGAAVQLGMTLAAPNGRAQSYPTRPVRIIVPAAPGGSNDILARLMGQWLSQRLGQQFIIENRPGGGSNIGTELVVNANPDGYTLLLIANASAVNATLYEKLNFNFLRDIAPVSGIARVPNVMELHPSIPAKTLPEFVAYAKANPGKISYASAGTGTLLHVAGELFKMLAGIEMVHVPYRGSAPALSDLLGGQVQMMYDNIPTSIEHIRAGKLIPLGVTTANRSELLPELPTVGEFLPGFEAASFFGVGAPSRTPREIVEKLNREINAGLADPKMKARLSELGPVLEGSPADFGRLLVEETAKWSKVVKFAGIKPD